MLKLLYRMSIFLFIVPTLVSATLSTDFQQINDDTIRTVITINLAPNELLYKDFMDFATDHPDIKLSRWHSNKDAVNKYDSSFKDTKNVYEGSVSFTIDATRTIVDPIHDAHLHFTYFTNTLNHPVIEIIELPFKTATEQNPISAMTEKSADQDIPPLALSDSAPVQTAEKKISWSEYVSTLVKKTESTPIRLLLVFLLGLMLSLTPCIYPMIPITAGILQSQGSSSFFYNFFISLCYACGMATTFAIFGLLAGCTGPLCGKLLMHPLFIAGLVIILGYLALSMLGLYELYVPSFLQPKNNTLKKSSPISVFIFGAASGTIASPCVSPGLALLLSIIATLGSAFLGFLLLFAFGIGLSTPLLIVGTFSSSINMLPRAGLWMVEVKKLFGIMMLGMCFYYLTYIISLPIVLGLFALCMLLLGGYYLYHSTINYSDFWQKFNTFLGTLLIIIALLSVAKAYRLIRYPETCSVTQEAECWQTNYQDALHIARQEHKKLFIDFWAQFCSICLAINKGLLAQPQVTEILYKNYIPLKVDGTFDTNEPFHQIKQKFSVTGFPTFLIVDPETESIIKQWGSELYSKSPEEFIAELKQYA